MKQSNNYGMNNNQHMDNEMMFEQMNSRERGPSNSRKAQQKAQTMMRKQQRKNKTEVYAG